MDTAVSRRMDTAASFGRAGFSSPAQWSGPSWQKPEGGGAKTLPARRAYSGGRRWFSAASAAAVNPGV